MHSSQRAQEGNKKVVSYTDVPNGVSPHLSTCPYLPRISDLFANRTRKWMKYTLDIDWRSVPTHFHDAAQEYGHVSNLAFLEDGIIL